MALPDLLRKVRLGAKWMKDHKVFSKKEKAGFLNLLPTSISSPVHVQAMKFRGAFAAKCPHGWKQVSNKREFDATCL